MTTISMNTPFTDIKYDTSNPFIEYTANKEYRACIRNIFGINKTTIMGHLEKQYILNDLDEETIDELCIDLDCMDGLMKDLYEITKNNVLFQTLYDYAAAKLISIDRTIGQCILFSYDYFYLFHPCICVYLTHPDQFTEECPYYIQLKEKLSRK
jgi:hypothetical protein